VIQLWNGTAEALMLTSDLTAAIIEAHGKGGRSKKMKNSDCSDKREVAEA